MALIDPPAGGSRYEPLLKLASGGMATVHVGAARGALGFRQIVALKRPHPHLAEDPAYREALLAEARVASRIHHANVVDVRDVEVVGDSIQLVMDYVEGAPLGQLIAIAARAPSRLPAAVVVRVVLDACEGLAAVHDLRDEAGAPLGLVHRDVSPQNILVGLDGVARVADFGVVKETRISAPPTTDGSLKGKIGYHAPEYVRGRPIDRRADVFALGVVLWEALAKKRLFRGASEAEALELVLRSEAPPVATYAPEAAALDPVIARAVAKAPEDRFAGARDFADALEAAARPAGLVAGHADVGRAVMEAVGEEIADRRRQVHARLADRSSPPPAPPPPAHSGIAAPDRLASRSRPIAVGLGVIAIAASASTAAWIAREHSAPPPVSAATSAQPVTPPPAPEAGPAAPSTASAPAPSSSPSTIDPPPSAPSARPAPEVPRSPPRILRPAPRPLPANPYR